MHIEQTFVQALLLQWNYQSKHSVNCHISLLLCWRKVAASTTVADLEWKVEQEVSSRDPYLVRDIKAGVKKREESLISVEMSGECSRYVSNGSWQGFSDDGKQRGLWCAVFVWFQHFLLKSLRGQRRRSLFCPSPPSLWAPVKELRILQYHPCLFPSWSTLLLLLFASYLISSLKRAQNQHWNTKQGKLEKPSLSPNNCHPLIISNNI